MWSFITQHNATDVASFEGACNWHADYRNVHQSCCPWIECSFLYHMPSPNAFQRIWQYIQLASQPQTTCNYTSQGPPHQHLHLQDRLRPATRTAAAANEEFLHKLSETVSGKLICMIIVLISGLDLTAVRRRNRLEWANAHIRWRLALWRGVLFMNESWFSVYRADGRPHVWRRVGEWFADVNVVAHGGGGVMVWAGVCYGQRTQVHFIDGILNTQRYRDEILRPIVVLLIHDHHLMLQHDNARPHVARICTQFLKAKNIPVLAWPAYSPPPDRSPTEHVWDALDRRIRQRVPLPANIQQLHTAIEEEWTDIPQATINNLINSMWRRSVALCEANGGHTIYWLVFGPPGPPPNTVKLHILEWLFIVASLRHTCAIIMLSNQHLDMPHLWGGCIISTKEKCSLTQI